MGINCSDYGYTTGKDDRLYEVCSDTLGRRVWINSDDGSAVARFNTSTGVDVHNSASDQMAGAPECLWCTHGKPDYKTWLGFIEAVSQHFGLQLSINDIDIGLLG